MTSHDMTAVFSYPVLDADLRDTGVYGSRDDGPLPQGVTSQQRHVSVDITRENIRGLESGFSALSASDEAGCRHTNTIYRGLVLQLYLSPTPFPARASA